MPIRLHSLQHVPFEGLGSIEAWARHRGVEVGVSRLHAREGLPRVEEIDWLVVMGGPMSVHDEDRYPWLAPEKRCIAAAIGAGKTLVGVCLGAQLIAEVLGARVSRSEHGEIGWFPVCKVGEAREAADVAAAFPPEIEAFHWHAETFGLPDGAVHLARSDACEHQAFVYQERVLALQFHLETTPRSATALIDNCRDELTPGRFVQTPAEMLGRNDRFVAINEAMEKMLDRLFRY
jgi:GMP synthase-like glutamine amidotransferase